MKTGPVHAHYSWAHCDASARRCAGRVPPADEAPRWPAYGDYLDEQNRRKGPLSAEVRAGTADAFKDSARLSSIDWSRRAGHAPKLGDVAQAPPSERPRGARAEVQRIQERLAPQGWLVDVIA